MISKNCLAHLRRLAGVGLDACPTGRQCNGSRTMATLINESSSLLIPQDSLTTSTATQPCPEKHVTTTIYSFPTMEPLEFAYYPQSHLHLPLRRDILHRAVIYEGDKTRQGTASTKWRDEVHGSHKKHHPQKGTGMARAGDKQSPIRRGGGAAFGPKPRDFSTGLNRKVYDLAWRTALSYRYRRGELIIVDMMKNLESMQRWYLTEVFNQNGWGNKDRRSMLVADKKQGKAALFKGMENMGRHGEIREVADVDVKNLLEMGRIVIERDALANILKHHSSDLATKPRSAVPSADLPAPELDV